MEETLSMIIHGCNLARNLESNLPHLSNHPSILSNYCDEIIRVLKTAKDKLSNSDPLLSLNTKMALHEPSGVLRPNELDAAVHEWLRSSYSQTMELAHAQISEDNKKNPFTKTGISGAKILEWDEMKTDNMLDSAEGSLECPRSGAEESGSGKSPVAQRSRKRKDGVAKWTVRVATPRMGNTDIPPDDGFTWRKYGQKEILGSMFPRGYYRCTHKTFYRCDAKKQVQRLDEDPNTFEVTYYGNHTCHISQTAPSPSPLSATASTSIIRQQESCLQNLSPPPPAPTSLPLHRWLSMDMGGVSKDTDTFKELQLQMYRDFNQMGESGNITSTGTAGPSNSRDTKGVEFPVVDFADAMFNSGGSSTSNSLDSIFPSHMQDS